MKMALGLNDSRRMWATGKVVAFNVLHGCEPVRMDGIVPAHKPTHPKPPRLKFQSFRDLWPASKPDPIQSAKVAAANLFQMSH